MELINRFKYYTEDELTKFSKALIIGICLF